MAIATFLSALSIVPHHCARWTDFLHPKLRKINVVLSTVKLITLTLWRAVSTPIGILPIQGPDGSRHKVSKSPTICQRPLLLAFYFLLL